MSRRWLTAVFGSVCLLGLAIPPQLQPQEGKAEEQETAKQAKKEKKVKEPKPRDIVERYQARLKTMVALGFTVDPRGTVEWRRLHNGEETLELTVRDLSIPDKSQTDRIEIDLMIGGRAVASLEVRNLRGRLKLESSKGHKVPEVKNGDIVELRRQGTVIMRGTFREK